ncbi:hypothetical protein RSAG8_06298, partial [Rhizoctonia solani AG-8 WAC10335]
MQYYCQCQDSAEQAQGEESRPHDQPEDEMDLREYINGIELEQGQKSACI